MRRFTAIFLPLLLSISSLKTATEQPTYKKKYIKKTGEIFDRRPKLIDEIEIIEAGFAAILTTEATVHIYKLGSPRVININLLSCSEWLQSGNTSPESFALSKNAEICSVASSEGFVVHIAMVNGFIIHSEQLPIPPDYRSKKALLSLYYAKDKSSNSIRLYGDFGVKKAELTVVGSYFNDIMKTMKTKLGIE